VPRWARLFLTVMNYTEAQAYLYSLRHHGAKYGIDRMRLLDQKLNYPHRSYPIIHVAGTNGKGSVCAMLESIYRNAGLKTGMFTSPHLVHLEERIQVNREKIPQAQTVEYTEYLKTIADELADLNPDDHPSFFEMVNAMAFLYFQKEKVDLAICETGLGGELDSTNVVNPLVSVITSISNDHTEILGDSLEAIAQAKAGIIKEGTPVLIGDLPEIAQSVICQKAKEKNAPLYSITETFGGDLSNYPETNLHGSFQRKNAALALLVTKVLKGHFPIAEDVVLAALQNVYLPGRWQEIELKNKSTLILDSAHNEESIQALQENLTCLIKKIKKKPSIIVGSLSEKRAKAILTVLANYAAELILVKPKQFRAVSTAKLKQFIPKSFTGEIVESNVDKLFCKRGSISHDLDNKTIVATGSIYLVGEILNKI